MQTTEDMVRALAAMPDPVVFITDHLKRCGVCRHIDPAYQGKSGHDPNCLWLAAREYIKENP